MAADKRVRAPYNFIPLSEKVLLPYNSIEELPPHDRMDPALKTGEIHVSMVADTPVFVSDGDKNEPHFFPREQWKVHDTGVDDPRNGS